MKTIASKNSKNVSVIGLGKMGSEIARLLLSKGYKVTVWNRTESKSEALVKTGAMNAPDVATAINASLTTIICLYDYKASDEILKTQDVAAVLNGKILVQLTTGSPQEARETEIWVRQNNAQYLDGAIQVAPDQMGRKDTTILLSGANNTYYTSEPVLKILGGNLVYLGNLVNAAAALDLATLSSLYGALLGFFHGARICKAEGFNIEKYATIVAEILPTFGAFLQHEGSVIHSGNYDVSQSPLKISVEATNRLLQTAKEAGINTSFPIYASGVLNNAVNAGYIEEELAAIFKTLN